MLQLGFTIPLMKQLKIKQLLYGEEVSRRFCWDLHGICLHYRSSLLAVHCETRYTFVLYDMTQAQWNDLPQVFAQGLAASLCHAGFSGEQVRRYLHAGGKIELTKTHGRREVAFLNRAWENAAALDYCVDKEQQEQPLLEHSLNTINCNCAGCEGRGVPLLRMQQSLKEEAI